MDKSEIKSLINKKITVACKLQKIEFESIKLDEEFNLIDSGIFDSMAFLELISNLEEAINKEIDISDYAPEQFTNYFQLIDIIHTITNK